jgi:CDP-diacylglycerol--glycerol-3-phosphate 3-phosphatidyltransferase
VPALLVALRLALAPVLLALAWLGRTGALFLALFLVAFLSDVLDGMVARRLGVSTAGLRRADSLADVALYGAVLASAWLTRRAELLAFAPALLAMLASQLLAWLVSALRFGRLPSYHAWSSKAWGVALCVATLVLFGAGDGRALLLAAVVGVWACLEDVSISLALTESRHDVPSLAHALRLRRGAAGPG